MAPENMKLYNVRVRPSTWEAARKIADHKGERISDVIRRMLTDYVHANQDVLDDAD